MRAIILTILSQFECAIFKKICKKSETLVKNSSTNYSFGFILCVVVKNYKCAITRPRCVGSGEGCKI